MNTTTTTTTTTEDGCRQCGDMVERPDGLCHPCAAQLPWDCQSCGKLADEDWPAWHSPADGMVLHLCDYCQTLEPSAHPVGRCRRCR